MLAHRLLKFLDAIYKCTGMGRKILDLGKMKYESWFQSPYLVAERFNRKATNDDITNCSLDFHRTPSRSTPWIGGYKNYCEKNAFCFFLCKKENVAELITYHETILSFSSSKWVLGQALWVGSQVKSALESVVKDLNFEHLLCYNQDSRIYGYYRKKGNYLFQTAIRKKNIYCKAWISWQCKCSKTYLFHVIIHDRIWSGFVINFLPIKKLINLLQNNAKPKVAIALHL